METSAIMLRLWCSPALGIPRGSKCLHSRQKLYTVSMMSWVLRVILACPVLCPLGVWAWVSSSREGRDAIFFFPSSIECEYVDFGVGGRFWYAESHHILSQRNRCTIWFWVWHPGFGSSSSTQLIKAQTVKSEDVKDKRVAFTCYKMLFKIILNRSVLTFTFFIFMHGKRTAQYINQASGNEHLLAIKSRFY